MKAIIVGAGPVGCLLASGLRERSFDVVVYEKEDDPRRDTCPKRGHSFNLTLSFRGLQALDRGLRERQYADGVRLTHRVIHNADGSVVSQPYGVSEDHHLLSIQRRLLHASLLENAVNAGADLRFSHTCIRADPSQASVAFVSGSRVSQDVGDFLIGCDGANSVIRQEMSQNAGLGVSYESIDHGYIELGMSARVDGADLLAATAKTAGPKESGDGFHIWPRGDFMLIAQPNRDASYTWTLFLPITPGRTGSPSFAELGAHDRVLRFFRKHFPDVVDLLPELKTEFHAAPPAQLKTVKCRRFHHHRTLLMGDAAHTILPFFGQGVNSGFEDIRVFLELLDRRLCGRDGRHAIRTALAEFTTVRKPACDAIADLSKARLSELANKSADGSQARFAVERELWLRHPDRFAPLYSQVAFTTTPYHEVVDQFSRRRRRLDKLCNAFDVRTEVDRIIKGYANDGEDAPLREEDVGLELSAESRKKLLQATVSRLLGHLSDLADGKYPASYVHDSIDVSKYRQGRQISARLRQDDVPQKGTDLDGLLSDIFDTALACGTIHPHPGFMAHIPSGGLIEGAVGSFLAAALNRFAGVWLAAPGLVQIECNVIRWFCSLLGYGEGSFGYLTTSGSIANMMGLMCALHQWRGESSSALNLYLSEQAHFSILKAARLVGIHSSQARVIRTRPDYTMDLDDLERRVREDRASGCRPFCVVATAGTTNTGAIDDLVGLAAFCRNERLWLHLDACFGGFFRITDRGRVALRGIEKADSIAVDAHKSLFLPHGNSALLVKDRTNLAAAFATPDSPYLPGTSAQPDFVDFCSYGPELSREIRGLTAWLPLKMHGIAAFQRRLDRTLDLAAYLAAQLERLQDIEVIQRHRLTLPVVVFRLRAAEGSDEANRRLCEHICSKGHVYVTTTQLPECGVVVRACILNHRTELKDVDNLITDVRSAMRTTR